MEQKDIISLNKEFDKLTKKGTKDFWKTNFPKLYDLLQNVTKSETNLEIQKDIQGIINKIIETLRKKNSQTKEKLNKRYDNFVADTTIVYNINKRTENINFNNDAYKEQYPNHAEYIKEIVEWLINIKNLVEI